MPSHDTAATTVDDGPSTEGGAEPQAVAGLEEFLECKTFAVPVPGVA
jgi:hypothetical protein